VTGVPECINEKRDASRAAGVELVELARLGANRAFGQRASRPRLAVAQLVEVIAQREDPTGLDPIQCGLLSAIVARVDDGIGLEWKRSFRTPLHQRIHVVRRQGADRTLHEERYARSAETLDSSLEARERPGHLRGRLVVRRIRAIDADFHRERRSIGQ